MPMGNATSRVAYAYPTSYTAKAYGRSYKGCWFIETGYDCCESGHSLHPAAGPFDSKKQALAVLAVDFPEVKAS